MKTRGFEVIRAYANKKITIPVRKTGCSAGYDIAAALFREQYQPDSQTFE